MKLWISGEIQADVDNAFAAASNEVEKAVNQRIGDVDYGPTVLKIALIPIIRKIESPDYAEIKKYTSRDKTAEFRLKIDHSKFAVAGPIEQRGLILRSLMRAIRMIPDLGVKDLDHERLLADLSRLARDQRWV